MKQLPNLFSAEDSIPFCSKCYKLSSILRCYAFNLLETMSRVFSLLVLSVKKSCLVRQAFHLLESSPARIHHSRLGLCLDPATWPPGTQNSNTTQVGHSGLLVFYICREVPYSAYTRRPTCMGFYLTHLNVNLTRHRPEA
jgi:hypothetical protein